MGTNYYLYNEPPCPHCGRLDEDARLHIGKSSAGWCFSLHVIPEAGINDLDDWREKWGRPGAYITDEYGREIGVEDMLSTITQRQWEANWDRRMARKGLGGYYENEADFHAKNHSERGPNGLLRHQIDGRHCIGHGSGTWDLIVGEFS